MNTFLVNGTETTWKRFDDLLLQCVQHDFPEDSGAEYLNAFDTLENGFEVMYAGMTFRIDYEEYDEDENTDDDCTIYEDIKHYNRVNHTHWVRWEQLESDRNVANYQQDNETFELRVWHI